MQASVRRFLTRSSNHEKIGNSDKDRQRKLLEQADSRLTKPVRLADFPFLRPCSNPRGGSRALRHWLCSYDINYNPTPG
jgi:hypothetical protein